MRILCEISAHILSLLFDTGMLSNRNRIHFFSLVIERFWALYSSPEMHSKKVIITFKTQTFNKSRYIFCISRYSIVSDRICIFCSE